MKGDRRGFSGLLANFAFDGVDLALPLERLFDDMPNMVFFIKDRAGRYVCVNRTMADRCGFEHKSSLIGKRPSDLYPGALAQRYERQDERVLAAGKATVDQLELHLYPQRRRGWCLTNKYPVTEAKTGKVSAIVGISRDVETSARGAATKGFPELAKALEALSSRLSDPPSVEELAEISGLSAPHFAHLSQRLFNLTPRQLAMKIRIDEALHLLATTGDSLAEIALATGFCDQSAFTRHFRRMTGLPPGAFRAQMGGDG